MGIFAINCKITCELMPKQTKDDFLHKAPSKNNKNYIYSNKISFMSKLNAKSAYFFLFAFLAAFILIAIKGLVTVQPGDENVYYYMGRLVAEGMLPYRDFFFAHPPLQIYLMSIIYRIFGFNIVFLKSLALASTLITSYFVFRIAKDRFGAAEAAVSSLLFLFAYSTMFNSAFSFGVEIATMFFIIGVYLFFNKEKYFLAGIFFGVAGITRFLVLIPIAFVLASLFFSNKKNSFRMLIGFLIVFLFVNILFIVISKGAYIDDTYKFHLIKTPDYDANFKEYFDVVKLNWLLFLSAILALFVKERKAVGMFGIICLLYLAFLLALNKIFGFYLTIIFPLLAVIGGFGVVRLLKLLDFAKVWKGLVVLLLMSIFSWNLAADVLFLEKEGFSGFERRNDLVDYVNSVSNEDTLLFGDGSVVPLLALLTNKRVAFDSVDTNDQVFATGQVDLDKVLERIKGKDILFIIRSAHGISSFGNVLDFLNKNCEFLSQFYDEKEGAYIVYQCKYSKGNK